MTEARGYERKAHLTPPEKLKVAYFYLIRGVAQNVLADLFDVNPGRAAEAVDDVRKAIEWQDKDFARLKVVEGSNDIPIR